MDNSDVGRTFLRYALPTIAGMMIVAFQSIIDGIFISRGVGPQGLAAVNLAMPLLSILFSVAIMITSGGVVIGGVAQGEGDERRVRGYTSLTMLMMAVVCLLMMAGMIPQLGRICYALGCDGTLYPFLSDYLRVILFGLFFFVVPAFTESFARLRGKPNWVFVSALTSCTLNVAMDWIFVLELGWGMKGAAAATVIANGCAALMLLHQVRFGRLAGGWQEVGRVFFNGSSEMITSVAAAVTTFIFNVIIMKHIGYLGVAALTIVYYFNMIVNYSTFGMAQAMYPLVAYQVGARNFGGVRALLLIALKYSFMVGAGVFVVILLFKTPIIGIFVGGDADLASLTRYAATYMTVSYLFSFINIIGSGFHTAIERPVESALIAVLKSFVFVIFLVLTLPPLIEWLGGDYRLGIWLSVPLGELMCVAVTWPLMRRSLVRLQRRFNR